MTHERFRADIEAELSRRPRAQLHFVYFEFWPIRWIPFNRLTAHPKYMVWQVAVLPLALRLQQKWRFDIVQHLTLGTFRYPSWLGLLGPPFIVGPVGGGERAPIRLFQGLPISELLWELLRTTIILSGRFDPLLRIALRRVQLFIARSRQTLDVLPKSVRRKAMVQQEIGSSPEELGSGILTRSEGEPLRALMVCRLLGWKGLHLAIEAASMLTHEGIDVEIDVCGTGRLMPWLRTEVERRGLSHRFRLLGNLNREELRQKYQRAHLLLFPSLHDSGGTAVIEALGYGLPVICLDLGGPAEIVTEACGILVATAGRNRKEVSREIAQAVATLAANESRREDLARGAISRAGELLWSTQVRAVEKRMEALAASKGPPCRNNVR